MQRTKEAPDCPEERGARRCPKKRVKKMEFRPARAILNFGHCFQPQNYNKFKY